MFSRIISYVGVPRLELGASASQTRRSTIWATPRTRSNYNIQLLSAEGGTWTRTPLRATDFKSALSTDSNTSASKENYTSLLL